jgi:hypothetical protein
MRFIATWSAVDFWMTIVHVEQVVSDSSNPLFAQNCGNSKK